MSKVVLVVGSNLHWAPYYYRYENLLKELKIEFDLIIWNRENLTEKACAKTMYEFNLLDKANNKNPLKVFKFFFFSNYVKKILMTNNYERIIFVGTSGCAAAFCSNYLSKHFKNKMWIDIRDDLYEWFKPYYNAQKKSIEASYATTISSPAYIKFLPKHSYLYMHNIDPDVQKMISTFKHKPDPKGRIRISFIGNVRYYKQNKTLIKLLGNDDRFILQYYGKGSDVIENFCRENNIKNVDFHGLFPQNETIDFYEKTDIINNVYGNETMNLKLALSNKLYYGLFLKLPILVSENTLMEKLIKEYNIGFTFRYDHNFPNDLYNWYKDVKENPDKCKFDKLWAKFLDEDNRCMETLKKFLLNY